MLLLFVIQIYFLRQDDRSLSFLSAVIIRYVDILWLEPGLCNKAALKGFMAVRNDFIFKSETDTQCITKCHS